MFSIVTKTLNGHGIKMSAVISNEMSDKKVMKVQKLICFLMKKAKNCMFGESGENRQVSSKSDLDLHYASDVQSVYNKLCTSAR